MELECFSHTNKARLSQKSVDTTCQPNLQTASFPAWASGQGDRSDASRTLHSPSTRVQNFVFCYPTRYNMVYQLDPTEGTLKTHSRFTLFFLVIVLLALAACAPTPPQSPPLAGAGQRGEVAPTSAPPSPAPSATSVPTIAAKTTTSNEIRFSNTGNTSFGNWQANIVTSPAKWTPGAPLQVQANLILSDAFINVLAMRNIKLDSFVMLVTAERTFDADGILRLPSDERMSTLLTPTGLGIEGGTQGAVSAHVGYGFRTPVDELVVVSSDHATKRSKTCARSHSMSQPACRIICHRGFIACASITASLPKVGTTISTAKHLPGADSPQGPCDSETYSPPIPASAKHVSGKMIDATTIKPRVPWVLLANYNSNGYRGVVAEQDQPELCAFESQHYPR